MANDYDITATQAFWEIGVITNGAIARFYNLADLPPEIAAEYYTAPAPAVAPGLGGFGGLTAMDGGLIAKRWNAEVRELTELRKRLEAIVEGRAAA